MPKNVRQRAVLDTVIQELGAPRDAAPARRKKATKNARRPREEPRDAEPTRPGKKFCPTVPTREASRKGFENLTEYVSDM